MTTSASRGRHTQLIPMETLNIKLRFLLAFCWGVMLEPSSALALTKRRSPVPATSTEGGSRLHAEVGLMPRLG